MSLETPLLLSEPSQVFPGLLSVRHRTSRPVLKACKFIRPRCPQLECEIKYREGTENSAIPSRLERNKGHRKEKRVKRPV